MGEKSEYKTYRNRTYRNDDITVYWKPSACIHASTCFRELIEVFDPGSRPWINMKGASTDKIIATVNKCPTEALAWKWNDETKNETIGSTEKNHILYRRPDLIEIIKEQQSAPKPQVRIMPDGPVVVEGNFKMISGELVKESENGFISFCRCGQSRKQPFCDGMHRKTGFKG